MQRIPNEKKHHEMPKSKKILICVIGGVLALAAVFGVLAFTHTRLNYDEAKSMTAEMISLRPALEKFLDTKPESLEFTDEEQKVVSDFETAMDKYKNYMISLEASNIQKNERVAEIFPKVKEEYGKLEKVASIWQDVKLLEDVNDDNLAKLKESKSDKLRDLANELSEYRGKIKSFEDKYGEEAKTSTELIGEYGELLALGAELEEKYGKLELADTIGMSRDDIFGFYAKIEELDKLLSEKI